MKNLCKYIGVYSLLIASTVGGVLIGYEIDRRRERVTNFRYVLTELGEANRIMKNVKDRANKLNQNAQRLLIDVQKFNEELRLRQIIRDELKLNGLREKLE